MDALDLALEDEGRRAEAQLGETPQILFDAMHAQASDEYFLARALYAVMLLFRPKGSTEGCLFKENTMRRVSLRGVSFGGVNAVLSAMRNHPNSRRMQHMG